MASAAPALAAASFPEAMTAEELQDDFGPKGMARRAALGNPHAQYFVASAYQWGQGGPRDLALARQWYVRAAQQGDPLACEQLAMLLEDLHDPGAITWLRKAASAGQTRAMVRLGEHLRGHDNAAAFRWLLRAADRDEPRARFLAALMLEAGQGTPRDPAAAYRQLALAAVREEAAWLRLQAYGAGHVPPGKAQLARVRAGVRRGDPRSSYELGTLLYDGIGTKQDRAAARRLFRAALAKGQPAAATYLCADARRPTATERSALQRAAGEGNAFALLALARSERFVSEQRQSWLRKAGALGNAEAEFELGRLADLPQAKISRVEGLAWLKRAAAQRHGPAAALLGRTLVDSGGAAGRAEGVAWLQRAARQGEASAMVGLADFFRGSDGVSSLRWQLAAREAGWPGMEGAIAKSYAEGIGVAADPVKALAWYVQAAERSADPFGWSGFHEVEALLASHPNAAFDYQALANWLQRAARWGYSEAQYELGVFYRDGKGLAPDRGRAKYWFAAAAKAGFSQASAALAALEPAAALPLPLLREGAAHGDAAAMWTLVQRLEANPGLMQDPAEARRWLEQAAAKGLPEAQFGLGRRMLDAKKDEARGLELVQEAARARLPAARLYLLDWVATDGVRRAPVPFAALRQAAEGNDPAAWLALAMRYREAPQPAVDMDQAIAWARKAAERGYAPAQLELAHLLGAGAAPSGEASGWLLKAAAAGHRPAVVELARGSRALKASDPHFQQAIALLRVLATRGDAEAMMALGKLLTENPHSPAALAEARTWYEHAGEARHPEAFVRLAELSSSPAEKFGWWERALAGGQQEVEHPMAEALLAGKGVRPDPARAIALLQAAGDKQAAEGDGSWSLMRLGEIFEHGEGGVPVDLRRALACYEHAAAFTTALPAFRAAELYRAGPAGIRDEAQALAWFVKAIDFNTEGGDGTESFRGPLAERYGNLANARCALAHRLEAGVGLPRDLFAASGEYQAAAGLADKYPEPALLGALKAASLAEPGAGPLGKLPDGTPVRLGPPRKWYEAAGEAVEGLEGDRLAFLAGTHGGRQLASDFWRRLPGLVVQVGVAAKGGSAAAQYDLGRLYLAGQGLPRNDEAGLAWLRRAADRGHLGAQLVLAKHLDADPGNSPEAANWRSRAVKQVVTAADGHERLEGAFARWVRPEPAYEVLARELVALTYQPEPRADGSRDFVVMLMVGEEPPKSLDDWLNAAKEQGLPDRWARTAFRAAPLMARAKAATREADRVSLWRQAAEMGHADAQVLLAKALATGRGTAKNEVEAYQWDCLAAAQGDDDGPAAMAALAAHLPRAAIAEAQRRAKAWWEGHP